jgi:hypothetical protein
MSEDENSGALRHQAQAASEWFKTHPAARREVLAAHKLPHDQLLQLMLEQPEKYVGIVRTLATEVKKVRAPKEVLQTVGDALEAMERGVKNLGHYAYARSVLVTLTGTTDAKALDATLGEAIIQAPDKANEKLLRAMRQKIGPNGGVVIETPGDYCHVCCVIGCALCGVTYCVHCCFVGCLICNIFTSVPSHS